VVVGFPDGNWAINLAISPARELFRQRDAMLA
jgi:hypothetical protein